MPISVGTTNKNRKLLLIFDVLADSQPFDSMKSCCMASMYNSYSAKRAKLLIRRYLT
jgi:hypothetical protein